MATETEQEINTDETFKGRWLFNGNLVFGTFGLWLDRMTSGRPRFPAEEYGSMRLSVQGSFTSYCTPRAELTLGEYEDVEVAFYLDSQRTVPSAAGIDGFDHLFETGRGPVGGYVPLETVEKLRAAIKLKAGGHAG